MSNKSTPDYLEMGQFSTGKWVKPQSILQEGKEMKQRQFDQKNEIMISSEDLEQANLTGFDRLELHLLNQAVVIFPGEMTAAELIEVSDSLLKLVTGLVDRLLKSCSDCDNCGQQEPCALMSGKSGDEDYGTALSEESTGTSLFSQISPELQKMLREHRICLLNLEEKMQTGAWVYFNGDAAGEC